MAVCARVDARLGRVRGRPVIVVADAHGDKKLASKRGLGFRMTVQSRSDDGTESNRSHPLRSLPFPSASGRPDVRKERAEEKEEEEEEGDD